MAAYLPVLPQRPDIDPTSYERALGFHQYTGFASASGNSYAQVVDAATLLKALRG